MNENKKSPVVTEDLENIAMTGIQVDPKEFAKILENAPIVSEIDKPEKIKSVFSSMVVDDGQF